MTAATTRAKIRKTLLVVGNIDSDKKEIQKEWPAEGYRHTVHTLPMCYKANSLNIGYHYPSKDAVIHTMSHHGRGYGI